MELVLERAVLKKGGFSPGRKSKMRIEIWATMTVKIAQALGAQWLLFNKETVIRDGFRNVELDADFATANVKHAIDRISEFTMEDCGVSKFVARASKPTKKKAKKISITFIVEFYGNNLLLMDHWNKVQTGEGTVTLKIVEQAKLDESKAGGKQVNMSLTEISENKSVLRYKSNSKDFAAAIEVSGAGPFNAMVTASAGKLKIRGDVFGPYDSEQDAITAGAQEILGLAERAHGPATTKKDCVALAVWAREKSIPPAAVNVDLK